MPTGQMQKWSPTSLYTTNGEIQTRMFDFGDPHSKKKISSFRLTFTGDTTAAFVNVIVYFRFHNNDTWKLFGTGATSGTKGKIMEVSPTYNSDVDFQMERIETNANSFTRIKNVYTIQFKMTFSAGQAIEINDYSVEYRTLRSVNISEPEA